MFLLAIIVGLISIFLLFIAPLFGIIGLILCMLVVAANNNRQKRQDEDRRHRELIEVMKNR